MEHFQRIADCLEWIAENQQEQPSLQEVANRLEMSPAHAQRLFKRAVGLSPKQFLQALTLDRSRSLLAANETVLETALCSGLSGPSRLHDLFVNVEAMTPGEFRARGAGLEIRWGVHPSPLGEVLVCVTDRGLAGLQFVTDGVENTIGLFKSRWPLAEFLKSQNETKPFAARVFDPSGRKDIPVLLGGSEFQIQVWQALMSLPEGARVSYQRIADAIGRPSSSRAVANAIGANPIAVLIPCHRVIRATGAHGGYRWGAARKLTLLAQESAVPISAV